MGFIYFCEKGEISQTVGINIIIGITFNIAIINDVIRNRWILISIILMTSKRTSPSVVVSLIYI